MIILELNADCIMFKKSGVIGIINILKMEKNKNKKSWLNEYCGMDGKSLVPSSSKGQLKIQEMAFMLVAVFLFFVLVGLFALSVLYSNMHKTAVEIQEQTAFSIINNLAESAEFSCGKPNCIDGDKIVGMIRNEDYKLFWPTFSSLRVIRQMGFNKNENDLIECNLATYPNCDVYVVFDREIDETTQKSFVALCRLEKENSITYKKCELAKLEIGVKKEL